MEMMTESDGNDDSPRYSAGIIISPSSFEEDSKKDDDDK
jgi:hypothetical protein